MALIVAFLLHSAWLAVVAEDAYISFRFARHLADGHGLVWNIGEAPVEGFTNLLWTLLAAAADRVGLEIARTMQLLGVAAGAATLWLADRFAAGVFGLDGAARTLPVLLLAASGPLATWSASGLETSLFALLALATLYHLSRWLRTRAVGDLVASWAALMMATLTRPEGFLLAAVAGWMTLRGDAPDRRHRPPAWAFLVAFALFSIVLTALRMVYFGAPLPNTFFAKTGGGGLQALRGAVYLGYFAFHFLLPLLPIGVLAWSRAGKRHEGTRRLASVGLQLWCACYVLYVVAVGGDYMAMYRFLVPILPALYLLVGRASEGVLGAGGSRPRRPARLRHVAALVVVAATAGTFVHSLPLEAELYDKPPRQHGTWRGVETERWHVCRLERLARFFEERARDRAEDGFEASLATRAIGILGFRTELPVYDFHGLVDARIARRGSSDRPIGSGLPGHEKADYEHVLDLRPTWWMFTRKLRDGPAKWPRYDREIDRRLRREYELVTVEIRDQRNREKGFFSFLELRDPSARRRRSGGDR